MKRSIVLVVDVDVDVDDDDDDVVVVVVIVGSEDMKRMNEPSLISFFSRSSSFLFLSRIFVEELVFFSEIALVLLF
jgi:hypothetical protein